jgi:hypothetical protein
VPITVPTCPHDDDQPARGRRAQRPENVLDRIGAVRVVDHRQRAVRRARDPLHAARNTRTCLDATDRIESVESRLVEHDEREHHVGHVEVPRDRRADPESIAGSVLEVGRRRPGLRCRPFNNPPVGWLVRGYRDDRDLRLSGEPAPVFVIDHDNATTGALLGEQRGLRREVVIEIVVEIEVVLGQVGKPGDVEHDGVDTPQDQRVAGNLQHAGSGTALAHDRE